MSRLLRIDSSSRNEGSHSRSLGDTFENTWSAHHPGGVVVRRDLTRDPIPHIASDTIAGFYTLPEEFTDALRDATKLSDTLIAELRMADDLLITVPMYNFTIPSALKAWVDHIVRIGHTFSYDGATFTGLVTGKRAFIVCAYGAGGYLGGGPLSDFNLLQSYLHLLLVFLGFVEITFIGAENTTADEATVAGNVAQTQAKISAALLGAA